MQRAYRLPLGTRTPVLAWGCPAGAQGYRLLNGRELRESGARTGPGYDSAMPGERIVTEDLAAFTTRAAELIGDAIAWSVARRDGCTLALAGGSTPRPIYARLAELPGIPWGSVSVFFTDERAVPPGHAHSNYRMAREALLSRVAFRPEQIHRMEAERPDYKQAARDYAALLPDPLDLLLLGVGADGHIASLFPGAVALREQRRKVVPVLGGTPRLPRLTITPPVVTRARVLFLMVAGADKADCVARALEGPEDSTAVPACLARHGTWILDRDAARALVRAQG